MNGCCFKTREVLEKRKQKYCIGNNKTVDLCIEEFNRKIKEGPYNIC